MSNAIAEMEQHIEKLEKLVERRNLVQKLEKNREFRKVILEDFCVTECANYAQLSADPNMSAESRADALALAQAAGHIRRWLTVCIRMGDQAEHELGQAKEELADLQREEAV